MHELLQAEVMTAEEVRMVGEALAEMADELGKKCVRGLTVRRRRGRIVMIARTKVGEEDWFDVDVGGGRVELHEVHAGWRFRESSDPREVLRRVLKGWMLRRGSRYGPDVYGLADDKPVLLIEMKERKRVSPRMFSLVVRDSWWRRVQPRGEYVRLLVGRNTRTGEYVAQYGPKFELRPLREVAEELRNGGWRCVAG